MNEIFALWQSAPWLIIGGALVALNVVLLILRITKKLIILAIGAVLIAIGIYTGVFDTPTLLTALPFWAV